MLKHAAIAALTCTFAPLAMAGDLTIAELAPQDAVVVIGIDNVSQAKASFERTGMMKIWDDPSVQKWFKEMSSEFMDDITTTLDEVGFEKDDLEAPTGAVGVSMWFSMPDGDFAEPVPHMLGFADYGDTSKAMHELAIELIEKGEEEETFSLTQDDYRDVDVFSMVGEDAGDEWDSGEPFKMSYAAHGGYLFMGTEAELVHHAIDTAMGDDTDTIGGNASYRSALGMVDGPNIHGVVLVEQLIQMFSGSMGAEGEMMSAMMDKLGVSDIKSVSMGAMLDTPNGVTEMKYAVRVPEKKGIVALLDQPAQSFSPPAFVDADTATFTTFQFDFAGLPAIITQILEQLPPEQAQMSGMFMGMAQPILENLGPAVHMTQGYTRPYSATSQQQLFVIGVKNADVLAQSINSSGMMFGLQARDFMGNQIWSMGGGPEFALGLGFGHLFVGSAPNVENAMRLASNPGDNSLASTKAFKRAASTTGRGIGFSYSDIRQTMQWADWYLSNMEDVIADQITQAFAGIPEEEMDAEWRDQLIEDAKDEIPVWMRNAPQIGDLVLEIMGDTISEYRSTPDGFVGTMVTLRPADD